MTNEQREAVENLDEIVNLSKEELQKKDENVTAILDYEDLKSLDTVLSLIKEQQEEIEKKDKIIDFYKKGLEREVESNRENVMEIIKKDKQIDYIIDFIRERSIYAVDTHEKLKQYFAGLVEKE